MPTPYRTIQGVQQQPWLNQARPRATLGIGNSTGPTTPDYLGLLTGGWNVDPTTGSYNPGRGRGPNAAYQPRRGTDPRNAAMATQQFQNLLKTGQIQQTPQGHYIYTQTGTDAPPAGLNPNLDPSLMSGGGSATAAATPPAPDLLYGTYVNPGRSSELMKGGGGLTVPVPNYTPMAGGGGNIGEPLMPGFARRFHTQRPLPQGPT